MALDPKPIAPERTDIAVSLQVLNPSGVWIPFASVTLEDGSRRQLGRTDLEGSVRFDGVSCGKQVVFLIGATGFRNKRAETQLRCGDALALRKFTMEIEDGGAKDNNQTRTAKETTPTALPLKPSIPPPSPVSNTPTPIKTTVMKPAIEHFTAEPSSYQRGQSSTLRWDVNSNATHMSIDQGIGTVGSEGQRKVSPLQTTTYTLTASGPYGTESRTLTITVSSPPSAVAGPVSPGTGGPAPKSIQVGAAVQQAKLIRKVQPIYPPLAKQARIQGVVAFDAIIGKDGTILNLQLISGHPLLVEAAREAVSQWAYEPTLFNAEPVEVVTHIDVNFTLTQ